MGIALEGLFTGKLLDPTPRVSESVGKDGAQEGFLNHLGAEGTQWGGRAASGAMQLTHHTAGEGAPEWRRHSV